VSWIGKSITVKPEPEDLPLLGILLLHAYTVAMRLFAALDISDDVTSSLSDWWEGACIHLDAKDWRHVPPHHWHLTLAFYGDVAGDDADDLAESLADCAARSPILNLKTEVCGVFPRPRRPRVFWAGVADASAGSDLKHLARCCRRVGHDTVRQRNAKETAFRAHITLARCRTNAKALDSESLELMPPLPQINWCVDSLSLFQSLLQPDGAQYRRLETFELKKRGLYVR
jgi:2'-5' RNA ligase